MGVKAVLAWVGGSVFLDEAREWQKCPFYAGARRRDKIGTAS